MLFNTLLSCFLLFITPVLYEGRYRPLETLPEGATYCEITVEDYSKIEGTPYLVAAGKELKYPSQGQLQAELLLYQISYKWILVGGYLLAALLLFRKNRISFFVLLPTFVLHTLILTLRCYILSRPPVANMEETLLYVPWIALLISFIFKKRPLALACGATTAALLLLFLPAHSRLSTVQAVLNSQFWLLVHVLMVVASYGVFMVAALCGHLYLLKKESSPHRFGLEKTLIQMMYLGTALLTFGTILGGIWAAASWGRFWDWDPKEAWAFISIGTYLIWIHAYRFKKIAGLGLAIGSILGCLSISFTWYGVNYILGTGLHSYGFGNGGEYYYFFYLLAELVFLGGMGLKNYKRFKNPIIEKKREKG